MNTNNENTSSDKIDSKKSETAEVEHVHGPGCNHGHSHSLLKPIMRDAPKVNRNDPCSCGSNKKFKKCCGI